MSDLLRKWLEDQVGIRVQNFEKDFASGYLFGQVFNQYNLQPDFDSFDPRRVPDAAINNFTRLQPTFSKMGIPLDSRTSNGILREEPGLAAKLVYSIQQNLKSLNQNLTKRVMVGSLGHTYGTVISPSRGLLDSQQHNSQKEKFVLNDQRHFEKVLRATVDNPNALIEAAHLRRFDSEGLRQAQAAYQAMLDERASQKLTQDTFRKSQLDKGATGGAERLARLERDNVIHAALMKHKEGMEREELRVELALSEKVQRKKLGELQHAALDATYGIGSFENNLKRLVSPADHEEGDSDETFLDPLKTRTPSGGRLFEDTAVYMRGVKDARSEDLAFKREREARRRRVLVAQQLSAQASDQKAQEAALMAALGRQSEEEQRLAARLWQLAQEKEAMREDRQLRQRQYKERRERDWDETIRREVELHKSMRQQYDQEAALEAEAWKAAHEQRAATKAENTRQFAESVAWQMVQLAERIIAYRSNSANPAVPRREWSQWTALFVADDSSLSNPIVKQIPAEEDDALRGASGAVKSLVEALTKNYLACQNEFATGHEPIGYNAIVASAVIDLAKAAQPDPPKLELPKVDASLRLAVVGAPFAGKTTLCQELSRQYRVKVLDVESLVDEAAKAAVTFEERYKLAVVEKEVKEQEAAAAAASREAAAKEAEAAEGGVEKREGEAEAEAVETTEEPPIEIPSLPEPSAVEQLGEEARKAMSAGDLVPDTVLMALVVEAMKASKSWVPPPSPESKKNLPARLGLKTPPANEKSKGFVLDGFPRSKAQAILLERALTGLDLDRERFLLDTQSLIAPPPAGKLPQLERPLTSGLDAIVRVGLEDEDLALRRALGRRVDPQTGLVYHLEFDPPPNDDPGLSQRLVPVQDESNDDKQIQSRLTAYESLNGPLVKWIERFSRLERVVEGSSSLTDVFEKAVSMTDALLDSKAAAASCKEAATAAQNARASAEQGVEYGGIAQSHAEAAARDLLVAKKAEIQAVVLLNNSKNPDPAATEVLRAQAAARCADHLKICRTAAQEAAGYAERAQSSAEAAREALDRARERLQGTAVNAQAEAIALAAVRDAEMAARAAAEASAKAQVCKEAADVAMTEAERLAVVTELTADAQLKLMDLLAADTAASEDAEAGVGEEGDAHARMYAILQDNKELCRLFYYQWEQLEKQYLEGLSLCLGGLTEEHQLCLQHFASVKRRFALLLKKASADKDKLVSTFQTSFNAIEPDVRVLKETRAELLLRAEELREALWAICDAKMEEVEAERVRVLNDSFVADHTHLLVQNFTALAQVELDRACSTLAFFREICYARHGVANPPADPNAAGGIVSPDLMSGQIPADLKDRVEPKSKNAISFPSWLSALDGKSVALQTAFKIALATVRIAVQSWDPAPEDPRKRKEGAKPGKGKKGEEEIEEPKLDPVIEADINNSLQACGAREIEILDSRLRLLAEKAVSQLEEITEQATSVVTSMGNGIRDRHCKECSAVNTLFGIVQEAAAEARLLPAQLRLEDDLCVLDENTLLVPPAPPPPPPPPATIPAPPAGLLTTQQLGLLTNAFLTAAPSGFMKLNEAADMLCRLAVEGALPTSWQSADMAAVVSACRMYDSVFTSYLDWREVVAHLALAAFPFVANADCSEMAAAVALLAEADKDADGLLSYDEWHGCELWFQYRRPKLNGLPEDQAAAAAAAADREKEKAALLLKDNAAEFRQQRGEQLRAKLETGNLGETGQLKQVLWDMFCTLQEPARAPPALNSVEPSSADPLDAPSAGGGGGASAGAVLPPAIVTASPAELVPRLDFRACLLYLCADRDMFVGVKKAFSVAAASLSPSAKCTASQVFKVAYPLGPVGQDIHRLSFPQAEIEEIVSKVCEMRSGAGAVPTTSAAVSAEQLMYSAVGERLVKRALDRYQWKDLYVGTKL